MNEYEVLRDGRNTIAVTLLRSVGELGDWGWFPTPEAQCLGEYTALLELIPHSGEGSEQRTFTEAYQFQTPWTVCQTGLHSGKLNSGYTPLVWEGDNMAFSSMKMNGASGDLFLRWYNMTAQQTQLQLKVNSPQEYLFKSNILEQPNPALQGATSSVHHLEVGPSEIVTVGAKLSF